jgi:hypothetical protein
MGKMLTCIQQPSEWRREHFHLPPWRRPAAMDDPKPPEREHRQTKNWPSGISNSPEEE